MIEQELFYIMKTIIPDLKQTEQFSYYDCYSEYHKAHIELKCRKTHYEELMIEKIKYDKLKKVNSWYINSTPAGIYSFNIQKLDEPIWLKEFMPMTTEFKNTIMIEKVVGYLDINQAKKIM
jgi:hypothetical protein